MHGQVQQPDHHVLGTFPRENLQDEKETDEFYPALLNVIKETTEYNNAAWLLKYQIESMLDIYKRLL